jgi:hypothetical protein
MERTNWFREARFGLFLHWGFELLRPDEQRIRPRGAIAGDVLKMVLQ